MASVDGDFFLDSLGLKTYNIQCEIKLQQSLD